MESMHNAFTYQQAEEICEDFEDLEGTEIIIHTDKPIKCDIVHVVIVPFGQEAFQQFIESYSETGDIKAAATSYTGTAYDVAIIARDINNTETIITQAIRDYINANGVRYNFPD